MEGALLEVPNFCMRLALMGEGHPLVMNVDIYKVLLQQDMVRDVLCHDMYRQKI